MQRIKHFCILLLVFFSLHRGSVSSLHVFTEIILCMLSYVYVLNFFLLNENFNLKFISIFMIVTYNNSSFNMSFSWRLERDTRLSTKPYQYMNRNSSRPSTNLTSTNPNKSSISAPSYRNFCR